MPSVDDGSLDAPARATKPLAAGAPSLTSGLVDNRFQITGEHARGGMSVIYVALDTWLGRRVALKTPRSSDPAMSLRILREAATLSRLDHPFILPVYHSGTLPDGAPYYVTKLVDGESLEERARRQPKAWKSLLRHVADIAEAVAYAHERGIVHRDLKPANVLIDRAGRTLVIDWGLAREMPDRPAMLPDLAITEPGTPVGTPGYWAPEQQAGGLPDPRGDVYSLGAILHRLIAGQSPDGASPADLAAAPPALRALVLRAMAEDSRERLASASQLAAELRRPSRLRKRFLLGALALAIAAAGVVVYRSGAEARLARRSLEAGTLWWSTFNRVLLRIDGDHVRGVYDYEDGVVEGTLDGAVLHLRWCEMPYAQGTDHGTAQLAFGIDGDGSPAFHGWFRYDAEQPGGNWDLKPAVDRPRAFDLERRLDAWRWRCPQAR